MKIESDPSDCVFCVVGAGSSRTPIVYASPSAVAFFPLRPAALGHTLVIPVKHIDDLWSLNPADAQPLMELVLSTAQAIRRSLMPDGLNLIVSSGAAATQTVPHLHFHLVPRWHGDSFGRIWPAPSPPAPTARTVRKTAHRIRAAMPSPH